ncbi:uncharacterized protein LOC116037728 [Sander lucioperca]|nr:uncharacterized protein LOC116037728 [Sander lucioperca]
MERQYIDLGEQAIILIDGPLIFFNLTANIFYACCLIFPPCNTQRLKQPLKMLLGLLVSCSIMYSVSLALLLCVLEEETSFEMFIVPLVIVRFYVTNSMTCSVWLNFYYYIQIVPAQRALLIWVKTNIKSVTYVILLFNGTFILFCSAVFTADELFQRSGLTNTSNTLTGNQIDGLYFTSRICFFSINVYIFLCLCILTVSSFSTAHYLHRHIKRVAQRGSFFSTPRIQSQQRVTVTGISQGVLYFLYASFYFFDSFTYMFSMDFYFSAWFTFTFTSLYTLGTTVNLAIGQVIFRQRAADAWKALKALCGIGMVTPSPDASQLTSGEIANTVPVDVQMSV